MIDDTCRTLLDASPEASLVLDTTGTIVDLNLAACAVYGYAREETAGLSLERLVSTEHRQGNEEFIRRVGSEGRSSARSVHRRKDGSLFEAEVDGLRLALAGRPHLLAVVRDLSGRPDPEDEIAPSHRALDVLDELTSRSNSAQSLSHLLDSILDLTLRLVGFESGGIYLIEESGAFATLSCHRGVEKELSQNFARVSTEAVPHATALKKGQAIFIQSPNDPRLKRGAPPGFPAMASIPIFFSDRVIGAINIASERSHVFQKAERSLLTLIGKSVGGSLVRMQAEDSLRANVASLRRITDNMLDMVSQSDLSGILRYVSPSHQAVLGYRPEEMVGKHVLELLHPEDLETVTATLDAALTTQTSQRVEARYRRADGRYVWLESVGKLLYDEDGKIAGAVFGSRDITERKRAEEEKKVLEKQLFLSQKLEAVGRLAGGVAHDFNNLLTVILGYSDSAVQRLHREDPLRQDLEQVLQAAERAKTLTHQLLAFSRKQIVEPRVVDVNETISKSMRMLERLLGEDVEIALALSSPPGRIRIDPGQFEQVLVNLAVNARDAMPKGGKLTIETADTLLDGAYCATHPGSKPGPHVRVSIRDNGLGMDAETVARIFEPFFTTKEEGKGTGLGLAMVYGIVKQSGGCIYVTSEPGLGTAFEIYFPPVDAQVTKDAAEKAPEGPLEGTETVLVVEDEEWVRHLVARFLSNSGYDVIEARGAGEAILLCENLSRPIDLVLTDVVMPGLSGPELVAQLERSRPGLKILYMTGYTDRAIVQHGMLADGVQLIQKPFTKDDLLAKVRASLNPKTSVEGGPPAR